MTPPVDRAMNGTGALETLLIDCLTHNGPPVDGTRLSSLGPEKEHTLLSLARAQRVTALLWHRLKQKGLDNTISHEAARRLEEALHRNTLQNLRLYGELRRLLALLKPERIPVILLKGIYLAGTVYESPGLREMSDVDVLARPQDLMAVAARLAEMGYRSTKPIRPETAMREDHHLHRLEKEGYGSFEVHWTLTLPAEPYGSDLEGLWDRAEPVRVAGCDALALSPRDLLLHLSTHVSYHHQFTFGLRPFHDIAEVIRRFGHAFDWDGLFKEAALQGRKRGLYLSLLLAAELAGAAVPAETMDALRPPDMTDAILSAARTQVFSGRSSPTLTALPMGELLIGRPRYEQAFIFLRKILIPRTFTALRYTFSGKALFIWPHYLRRLTGFIRWRGRMDREFAAHGPFITAYAARVKEISAWLSGPGTGKG